MSPRHRAFAVRGILAAMLLAFVAPSPSPAAEGDKPGFQERFERLKKVFVLARTAARRIPADTFDPDAVLRETGDDYRRIHDWVAKNTTWVPYRGALRGARGVLMDRVGSHLDRALLLAELLKRAGHEVRIERGVLPPAKVDEILAARAGAGRSPEPEPPEEERVAAQLAEAARILEAPLDTIEQTWMRSRIRSERFLEELTRKTSLSVPLLSKAFGIDPAGAPEAAPDRVRDILADDFRAAVRRGKQWIPCDPLAGPGGSGEALFEEIRETADPGDLPEDWCHRLTIRVEAERWADGKLARKPVLVHEMHAADLLMETPSLTMKPLDWPRDLPKVTLDPEQMKTLADRTEKAFLEQKEWLPMLDLKSGLIRQKSFLADGRVVDHPSITLESRKIGRAQGALGALGSSGGGDGGELTAVFVVIGIRGPGAEPFTTERTWIDLVGPARRDAGVPALELSADEVRGRAIGLGGAVNLLALPCRPSEEWLARRQLDALLENRIPILGALYAGMRDQGDEVSKYLGRGRPAPMELYSLVGNRYLGPGSEDLFVNGLNVVASFTRPVLADGGKLALSQALDLVRVTADARPDAKRGGAAVRFAQGVKDTVAEALTLPRTLGERQSAAESYARAVAAGREWVLLSDPGEVANAAIALSNDSRARVRRALEEGKRVLAPPAGDDEGVWWEHDPATGAVLGRTAAGHGGAAEEIVLITNDAFSLIMTLKGVLSCRGKDDLEMACCLLQNAAFGGYGLSVGASFGKAGLDLWGVAFNVAYTAATNEIDLCGG